MEVTAIVLAGGKSLRLGRDKALENILGKSLVERAVDRVRPLASQVLIVTSKEHSRLPSLTGTEILHDVYPGKGPLGGIYTGLLAAKHKQSIVVACDMPFLNTALLTYMVELCPGFDAVVPRLSPTMVEPLQAVYARSCLEEMRRRVDSAHLEVHALLPGLRVRYVEREECERFDRQLLSFLNVNNQSDLDRAIAIASQDKP